MPDGWDDWRERLLKAAKDNAAVTSLLLHGRGDPLNLMGLAIEHLLAHNADLMKVLEGRLVREPMVITNEEMDRFLINRKATEQ